MTSYNLFCFEISCAENSISRFDRVGIIQPASVQCRLLNSEDNLMVWEATAVGVVRRTLRSVCQEAEEVVIRHLFFDDEQEMTKKEKIAWRKSEELRYNHGWTDDTDIDQESLRWKATQAFREFVNACLGVPYYSIMSSNIEMQNWILQQYKKVEMSEADKQEIGKLVAEWEGKSAEVQEKQGWFTKKATKVDKGELPKGLDYVELVGVFSDLCKHDRLQNTFSYSEIFRMVNRYPFIRFVRVSGTWPEISFYFKRRFAYSNRFCGCFTYLIPTCGHSFNSRERMPKEDFLEAWKVHVCHSASQTPGKLVISFHLVF